MRPFLLLVRGARRGCFHPRSFAVLTDSLPRRAFSPRARLSAAAVWRLLLRGQHGYTLLYAICRGLSSRRVYFLCSYTEGILCAYRSAATTYRRKTPPPSAARYFPSRRGAALKAYFVYVEAPQRPIGEKAPPPSAARYFSSRRGAALKAYFVYVEVLQRRIGEKEPPPTRPRRRTPAYTPPPPRFAPARTHP